MSGLFESFVNKEKKLTLDFLIVVEVHSIWHVDLQLAVGQLQHPLIHELTLKDGLKLEDLVLPIEQANDAPAGLV